MNITVSGIGYVGLANAVLLSQRHRVTALDISEKRVDLVNRRVSPLEDREIEDYLANKKLSLAATNDRTAAYSGADYIIVATPTDYDAEKNHFDTSSVESVIGDISRISPSSAIVVKSTVPIGFTRRIRAEYPELSILFSPEFLREGKALYDNLYPSRIIIGGKGPKAREFAGLLLEGAIKKDVPVLYMESSEAEAVKLFSNTYLALRIAFFNELDTFAELNGFDTKSLIEGICLDPRIGSFYNNPSFGYGGYCLPKDTRQLKRNYDGVPNSLIGAIVDSNRIRKEHIRAMVEKRNPKTAGVYRLAMKSGSDNFRSSAVLDIIGNLQNSGIEVIIFDPALQADEIFGCPVLPGFDEFRDRADVIIANRMSAELESVRDKVYTRDVFFRD